MLYKRPNFLILAVSVWVCGISIGCISGPKDPEQNFAEQFNGENYNTSKGMGADHLVVPVLSRKEVRRIISGKVYCGEGISQYPANNAVIVLSCQGQKQDSGSTKNDGTFQLNLPYPVGDECALQFTSKCGMAHLELPELISRDYPEQNIHLK
jgi:hypothetical protein